MKQVLQKLCAIFVFFTLMGSVDQAFSRPVSFQNSFSLMSENTRDKNENMIHFTPHFRFSVGAKHLRMQQESQDLQAGMASLNLLLLRWNHPAFQANTYALGGFGAATHSDQNGWISQTGIQADAENRRLYSYFRFNMYRSNVVANAYATRGRLGLAPYLGEYDELNAWLMLQYDYERNTDRSHHLTPFVRFFYRNVLVEVGSSLKGRWMFNLVAEM